MKQLVIIDVPEDTMPEDFMPHDTVPPRVDGRQLSLRSYQDLLLTAMTNANEDGEDLVKLLYGPRRKHSWAADGTLMMEAPTMEECERKLEFALSLLHRARFKATNVVDYADTLTHNEMTWALDWLKDVYQHRYLTRPSLSQALTDWHSGFREFSSAAKDLMRRDFRSGFRAFLRDTVGDASVAYAILRHGYYSPQALTRLVQEVFQAREDAKRERERCGAQNTRKSHPHLAEAARKARRAYAQGERVAMTIEFGRRRYEDLNEDEQELHRVFHTGQLTRQMIAANKEYGHGLGAPDSLSIEQIAHIAVALREQSRVQPPA